MSDNQALREILGQIALFRSIAAQQYDDVTGVNDQSVSDEEPYERAAEPTAVKTVVTNVEEDSDPVRVFEEGVLVAVLAYGESWVSPLNGAGAITVDCAEGGSSTIALATYTKS